MAEGGGEKQFIGKLLQKQTKYGTNSPLTQKSSVYIKHLIGKADTLMGIALKYGVTVRIEIFLHFYEKKNMSTYDCREHAWSVTMTTNHCQNLLFKF